MLKAEIENEENRNQAAAGRIALLEKRNKP
jgi:hypothetical protein